MTQFPFGGQQATPFAPQAPQFQQAPQFAPQQPAFPTPPRELLGPDRIPAGRWLAYREALAAPFATLTPVAVRLGYRQD